MLMCDLCVLMTATVGHVQVTLLVYSKTVNNNSEVLMSQPINNFQQSVYFSAKSPTLR